MTWWDRVVGADHGVLATVHPERGVDAVPVVFAVDDDGGVVIPVDTVKRKRHTALQRLANLRADPRCTLLVERYSDDWAELWWVRVHGRATVVEDPTPRQRELLAARYPPYAAEGAVASVVVLTPDTVTGWAAT